jgi:hypothetical protein
MAIQDLLKTLGQRVGTGLERMGATTDPTLSPEAQRLAGIQNLSRALRRTGATLSGDPQRMALQAQEDERLRQRRLDEERKRKLMAFAQQDPFLARMYEVFGEQGLREGYVRKEQIEQQEQINTRLNEAIDKSDFSATEKEMLKLLDIKDKSQFLQENIIPQVEVVPVDIKKLNQLRLLRGKFDENSPNYDPTYTEKQFKQEASILGVSSTLLDPPKEKFITDYMKTITTQYKAFGRPQFTQAQAREMAETMYEEIYGNQTTVPEDPEDLNDSEKSIDLGDLSELGVDSLDGSL